MVLCARHSRCVCVQFNFLPYENDYQPLFTEINSMTNIISLRVKLVMFTIYHKKSGQ